MMSGDLSGIPTASTMMPFALAIISSHWIAMRRRKLAKSSAELRQLPATILVMQWMTGGCGRAGYMV